MRISSRLAAFALAAFLLPWGAARAACPGDAGEPLPARETLAAAAQELERLAFECGTSAGYLAYHGAVLNALGRPAEAALLLERAILLEPSRAGFQIDYADALIALDDGSSAAALLREVLARPDVPASIRPLLERRLQGIDERRHADPLSMLPGTHAATDGWQGAGSVTLKLGRESNLNSAPAREAFTLTLPAGDAVLQLADRFRPRSGSAARIEASAQALRQMPGGGALQLYGDARRRESSAASDTDYQQLQAGGAWSEPLAGGAAVFGAGATQLRYGGAELYRALRLTANRAWQTQICRPSLGVEGEWRRYPTASELEGRYTGLSAGLVCSFGADRLTLALRSGRDAAQASRPGGDQRQGDLRAVWSKQLGPGRASADLLWYRQNDASGYSPLLAGGATRRMDRTSVYLEYAYPVAPGWSVLASVEHLAQRSNLELFELTGRAVFLGLRWNYGP